MLFSSIPLQPSVPTKLVIIVGVLLLRLGFTHNARATTAKSRKEKTPNLKTIWKSCWSFGECVKTTFLQQTDDLCQQCAHMMRCGFLHVYVCGLLLFGRQEILVSTSYMRKPIRWVLKRIRFGFSLALPTYDDKKKSHTKITTENVVCHMICHNVNGETNVSANFQFFQLKINCFVSVVFAKQGPCKFVQHISFMLFFFIVRFCIYSTALLWMNAHGFAWISAFAP